MIIAQITDFHVSYPGSHVDRFYRTAKHLEACVKHIMKLEPRPDLVLATGDLVDSGSIAEYERLKAILAPITMPLYLIPGNHDQRENLRVAFDDHHYLSTDTSFLQYVVDDWPVRLVALDTLVPGDPGGELCDTRLNWLAEKLGQEASRPTIIFMHHPPFPSGIAAMDAMGLTGAGAMGMIVARNPQVERVLCGHIHRPIQTLWNGTIASVCPSTAQQIALDLRDDADLTLLMEPPGCQLHVWQAGGSIVTHTSYVGQFRTSSR